MGGGQPLAFCVRSAESRRILGSCVIHMGLSLFFWGPWMIIGGTKRDELSGLASDKWAAAYDRPNGAASIRLPTMR